jgi:hypothetical protein
MLSADSSHLWLCYVFLHLHHHWFDLNGIHISEKKVTQLSYVWHSTMILQWKVVYPKHLPSWVLHHEATCTHHRNNYSYKQLVVIMFEWPDYSLVKWLENTGAVWKKNHNVYFLQVICVLGISSTLVTKSKILRYQNAIWGTCSYL